jgi:hypothetical protein
MTWLEDRMAERKKRAERHTLISHEGSRLFLNLSSEIQSVAEEANRHRFDIAIEPSSVPYEYKIRMDATKGRAIELQIKFDPEGEKVTAVGRGVNISFKVDVRDGTGYLKQDGKELSPADAAKAILDPLLFPDLH